MDRQIIRKFVLNLGITPDLVGYEYTITAIELLMNRERRSFCKLYSEVAKLHNTTDSKVNRGISHAITTILRAPYGFEVLEEVFSCRLISDNLSNSKFLALCADALKNSEVQEEDLNEWI